TAYWCSSGFARATSKELEKQHVGHPGRGAQQHGAIILTEAAVRSRLWRCMASVTVWR
ncbi:hypothetical protein Dimus_005621, partial [Dionaea muscipula]